MVADARELILGLEGADQDLGDRVHERAALGRDGVRLERADEEHERPLRSEPVAYCALERAPFRQAGHGVTLREHLQLRGGATAFPGEVARHRAHGDEGDEPDRRARGDDLGGRDRRVQRDAGRIQHGCAHARERAEPGSGRERREQDRQVVEMADAEAGRLVEQKDAVDRRRATGRGRQEGTPRGGLEPPHLQ